MVSDNGENFSDGEQNANKGGVEMSDLVQRSSPPLLADNSTLQSSLAGRYQADDSDYPPLELIPIWVDNVASRCRFAPVIGEHSV
jgi:hypothetical protein